jgi:HK97 family phage major capsid protein/HK97 family phage prohead protease
MQKYRVEMTKMSKPTQGMKEEARKGLDWRKEYGRGGTRIGAERANQILNNENLSDETIKRMYSFFSRHEVDKKAEGFRQGEKGYPSNGRIAWALWGGDAGFSWSRKLVNQMKNEEDRAMPDGLKVGDFVSWNSSGGRARGKIIKIERDGTINVPDSDFVITGTSDDPAALIQVYRSGEPTDTEVGHKFSTLTKINPIRDLNDFNSNELEKHPLLKNEEEKSMNKEDRHILNVSETDDKVIVEFAKHEDVEKEGDELEITDEVSMAHEEEERKVIDMPMKYRTIDLSKHSYLDEENRRVRIGVSSEEPVERSFGMEVLGHSADDINMEFINSGRAPLLLDHDMTKQIGVIEEFKLDETAKRSLAVVRFGKSALAQEVFEDVKDGIRMNISVGYRIDKLERMNDKDETYYKAKWTPMEVSSVSVPADQSRLVGVGRSKNNNDINFKEIKMSEDKKDINLDEVRTQTIDEAKAEFKRNSKEIIDLAARHNKRDLADKAIADGISVEEFRGVLLENISNNTPLETPSEIGMTKKEVRQFSLVKAIRAMANPSDRKAQEDAAFEFECSAEAARQYGKDAQGIMLPAEVLRTWKQRDINSSDDSTLIAEDYRGGDFIDVLRNSSSVMQAGATMLRGLQGNVVIPKKTAAASAGWIATEGAAAAESEFTSGSVTMSPKVIGAFTDATRLLLQQSSLDVENLIRDDLTQSIATAIDLGALAGSGSSGQPTGISNTSGINTTTFAAANPTWAEIVAMESAVANDNALNGSLSYICRPADFGTLKTTEKATNTAQFVVSPDNSMNGYNVIRSNQVTSGDFYFGNFADLLIGMYGGLDITVDPYALSTSGGVRIVALQTVDVAVRHAVSFCKSSD